MSPFFFLLGRYPLINDDLVNSHHLLLCCLDMVYTAAYTKRRDLIHCDSPINHECLDNEEGDGKSILGQLCQIYNGELMCVCEREREGVCVHACMFIFSFAGNNLTLLL